MAIPTPPAAPNPLGTNFAAEALAFTQWMQTAAPEFNTAVGDANQAVTDAEQAVVDAATQVGLATTQAGLAATQAGYASGHATAADNARGAAVTAKTQAEDARDMSQTYAALAGAAAGLPALAGQALKNLRVKTDETGVEWTAEAAPGSMARSAKTGAYTLVAADKGALIDCSGTWTLGLTAAATLGAGWWCYVRNVGTGTITADPNGAETIDGLTTGVIRPGMTLLIQCDGSAFHCLRVGPHVAMEVLTSGTSWTCPLGVRTVRARITGPGGNGAYGPYYGSGGGGGGTWETVATATPGAAYAYAIGAAPGGVSSMTIGGATHYGNSGSNASGVSPGYGGTASGANGVVLQGIPGSTSQYNAGIGMGGCAVTGFGRGGSGLTNSNAGFPTSGAIILEY